MKYLKICAYLKQLKSVEFLCRSEIVNFRACILLVLLAYILLQLIHNLVDLQDITHDMNNTTRATNRAETTCPSGLSAHPVFSETRVALTMHVDKPAENC